jgi:uncharacterized membrane protein YccC
MKEQAMHESMSILSSEEWSADRRRSNVEDALVRLDETVAKAGEVVANVVNRLDLALQPETTETALAGLESDGPPRSLLVRRIEEASREIDRLIRRLTSASDRLDI